MLEQVACIPAEMANTATETIVLLDDSELNDEGFYYALRVFNAGAYIASTQEELEVLGDQLGLWE